MTKRQYNQQAIAERIRNTRSELGMTQKELSKASHISLSAIKKYESSTETRIPEDACLESLAKALGVYPDWILGKKKYRNENEELDSLIKSLSDEYADKLTVFSSFNNLMNCLGYSIDYEESTISFGRKKKKSSPETINHLYWSIINDIKERFENIDNIEGSIPLLPRPYGEILKEGDADGLE